MNAGKKISSVCAALVLAMVLSALTLTLHPRGAGTGRPGHQSNGRQSLLAGARGVRPGTWSGLPFSGTSVCFPPVASRIASTLFVLASILGMTGPCFRQRGKKRFHDEQPEPVPQAPDGSDPAIQAFSHNRRLSQGTLLASDIMSRLPPVILPTTPKFRVVSQMRGAGLQFVLVCDSSDKLAGIISERDCRKKGCIHACEMMTPDPPTVQIDDEARHVISMMNRQRVSCLPVLDGERVSGVITVTEIANALQGALSMIESLLSADSQSACGQRVSGT
jgi:CBS domain-containing protein